MSLYDDLNNILNEATYYGKNKELLKIEKSFADIKSVLSVKAGYVIITNHTKYRKYISNIEKTISELFGFRNVYINTLILSKILGRSPSTLIQCATPIDLAKFIFGKYDAEQYKINNIQGVRFKPGSNIDTYINMPPAVIVDVEGSSYNLTPKELTAILLHEIGHSFYNNKSSLMLDQILTFVSPNGMLSIAYTFGLILLNKEVSKLTLKVSEPIDFASNIYTGTVDHLELINTIEIFFKQVDNIKLFVNFILAYLDAAMIKLTALIMSPKQIFKMISSKEKEYYSDNFATSFGYGDSLITALTKLQQTHLRLNINIVKNNKIGAEAFDAMVLLNDILKLPLVLVNAAISGHPNAIARLMNSIEYMEDAVKGIDDPRLKKEYQDQLLSLKTIAKGLQNREDEDKTLYDKLNTVINSTMINNPILKAYHKAINKLISTKNIDF